MREGERETECDSGREGKRQREGRRQWPVTLCLCELRSIEAVQHCTERHRTLKQFVQPPRAIFRNYLLGSSQPICPSGFLGRIRVAVMLEIKLPHRRKFFTLINFRRTAARVKSESSFSAFLLSFSLALSWIYMEGCVRGKIDVRGLCHPFGFIFAEIG